MLRFIENFLASDFWLDFMGIFQFLGFFAGIGIAMIEAFFPPLPLSVFVTINIAAYGFWKGYLASWIGTCLGSFIVFYLIKRLGYKKFSQYMLKHKRLSHIFLWINEKGALPIFFLFAIPFTPSFIVCGISALAGVSMKEYIYALIFGKMITILSISVIGYNIVEFVHRPILSSILIILTLGLSYVVKKLIQRYKANFIKDKTIELKDRKKKAA